MAERACPPHTWHRPRGSAVDVCRDCKLTYAEAHAGFGSNGSKFEMPPSRSIRRKSNVAKRFGQAFGED